jgi:Rps23 Pro-64 3,4-dihydroxylase Tpa1-like proline 4-hydroxylase
VLDLARPIAQRLESVADPARAAFGGSAPIRHAVIDELLPDGIARQLNEAFPPHHRMVRKRSLREDKYIGVQMDVFDPLIAAIVFAFQDVDVLTLVGAITGLRELEPDVHLYAGGISTMVKHQFLNPHLDNSHDRDRARWRVLNLLYYVSPSWSSADGGHLELWPDGLKRAPQVVESRFNRLVIMETHDLSLHSVSPVLTDRPRHCVSNYYFSPVPIRAGDTSHVTSFRGRPGQPIRDLLLRGDAVGKTALRRMLGRRMPTNPHVYKR